MISLGMTHFLDVLIYMLFILCGISRLGYFNVHASLDNPVKYYNGLPVTSTAIIYPLLGLLHGNIAEPTFCLVYIIATLITAILFVAKIKIPKLKGSAYVIVPILALLLGILLVVIR
jgi:CDP-diacylglycerol--serine O-phosphatidyltransferase